ncbi:MAG: bifunctional tetrahydrofolate synthase/dihydrofolate synthase [Idiomarina sp.]|nr:bifunctional tetrahydrofolate synthase/dihydrofolate synthase [Idiomarinaceae bacterium]NQZ03683.1 bifunctional tetrahydrofolate synthase/dihydrofolate synthase [Idiomarina sp.]|tara:strand:+ start:1120 stop:2397 length:1278 start_codon:yes stop_codon:yes gene_type:complete
MSEHMIAPTANSSLSDWLTYLEKIHPTEIDLGLERSHQVRDRAELKQPARFTMTVAGTNGKGSTVAMLSSVLQQAGYKVGVYTSPHLVDYRERVQINNAMLPEADHAAAFAAINDARQGTSLTYFEMGTLAALWLMQRAELDVAILEVGLGGRLDAVNVVDADVAVITSIGIDHVQFLGDNREKIGFEKAGIARRDTPLICGDNYPPKSIAAHASSISADLKQVGRDFSSKRYDDHWHYYGLNVNLFDLPLPQLPLINAVTTLAALECLPLAVSEDAIKVGLAKASLMGRMQRLLYRQVDVLLDVAHNGHAAHYVAQQLARTPHPEIIAVVGMLKDKDANSVFEALTPHITEWALGTLHEPRGNKAEQLAACEALNSAAVNCFDDIEAAFDFAIERAQQKNALVFAFGSFYTVGHIFAKINSSNG